MNTLWINYKNFAKSTCIKYEVKIHKSKKDSQSQLLLHKFLLRNDEIRSKYFNFSRIKFYITIMQRLILFIFHLLYLFKITIYNFQFFFDFESHLRYHEEWNEEYILYCWMLYTNLFFKWEILHPFLFT